MKVEVPEGILALRNRFTVVWEPSGAESRIINCQFTSMLSGPATAEVN